MPLATQGQQPGGPAQPHPGEVQPAKDRVRAGGINAVAIICLALMVAVAGLIGYQSNRIRPASAAVDSAWQSHGGRTADLTQTLRGAGFQCTNEDREDGTYRRVCADYTPENPRYIEFAGSAANGEVYRVYLDLDPKREDNLGVATEAIHAVVPDTPERPEVVSLFGANLDSDDQVVGEWGVAGYVDGVFMATNDGTSVGPGTATFPKAALGPIHQQAERAGYTCEATAADLSCTRASGTGDWTVDVHQADFGGVTNVTVAVQTNDRESVDVIGEVKGLLTSDEVREIEPWLNQVPTDTGRAGLWRGQVLDYRVDEAEGSVSLRVGTTCHPTRPDTEQRVC